MDTQSGSVPGGKPAADPKLLVEQLKLLNSDPTAFEADAALRHQIMTLARSGANALEAPFETLQRVVYAPMPIVTVRIGQGQKIFSTLVEAKQPVSFDGLVHATGLEAEILDNVLDYLGTQDMLREVGKKSYIATKSTHLMVIPLFQDAVTHFHDNCVPGFVALNEVLSAKDQKLNAFKLGQHTEEDFYAWLESRGPQKEAFHNFMEGQFASLPTWLDVVNFGSEMAQNTAPDEPSFVDVGGGNGSQCAALKSKVLPFPGRMVLQDRPDVLQTALHVEGMEVMPYDYNTEQSVKNARVYYFRQIFHNNDDETCLNILKNQVPAMGPNSVIIIDDKAIPDDKPVAGSPGIEYTSALSIAMKVMFNAQERKESQWRDLIGKAGLVIKDIRIFTQFHDAAIIISKS